MFAAELYASSFMQAKEDATELQEKVKALEKSLSDKEAEVKQAKEAVESRVKIIGNLVHDSVVVHDDEVSRLSSSRFSVRERWKMKPSCGSMERHTLYLPAFCSRCSAPFVIAAQAHNQIVRTWGTPRAAQGLKSHVDLVDLLGIADLAKGTF